MQRRVALARALAVGPRLLLLDEPFVSLDRPLARDLIRIVARAIAAHGPTAIRVTHDPEDAARLADRVIRLEGRPARVVADDPITTPRDARSEAEVRRIADALAAAAA
jgi:NitT/TauT family transport system ATP-binding protein/sulfonate transport system ATP-binding protein